MQATNLMNPAVKAQALERCRFYIVQQLQSGRNIPSPSPGPAITISHETGAGAHDIALRLPDILHKEEGHGACPWTIFNRQLMEIVLQEHHLPKTLAKYMPEDQRSFIRDVMEELVGLRPPSWVMIPKIAETVLHLASSGHVILVGRGSSFITARMPNVFHVRLVAALSTRIERVQQRMQLDAKEAASLIKKIDRGRGRYVKTYFHKRLDEDSLYHLVINTDAIQYSDATQLIADAAHRTFQRFKETAV